MYILQSMYALKKMVNVPFICTALRITYYEFLRFHDCYNTHPKGPFHYTWLLNSSINPNYEILADRTQKDKQDAIQSHEEKDGTNQTNSDKEKEIDGERNDRSIEY